MRTSSPFLPRRFVAPSTSPNPRRGPRHQTGRSPQPIGTVKTETPLLDAPLGGLAYAVSGYGGLPHVVFILAGQVMVIPQGESKQTGRGLRTEVPVVPDVPIGHFRLTLFGGKQGYLANTRDLCGHTPVVEVAFGGQNGRSRTQRIKVSAACGDSKHRAAPSPLAVFESAKSLNRP